MSYNRTAYLQCLFIFLVYLTIATATPKCKYQGRRNTELVCTPNNSTNYILKRGLLSDSNKTTSIILSGCRISDIKKESFQNLFYLESLDLSDNVITNLKLGVLDGTRRVTHLNLSTNLISQLPLGLFDQKAELLTLDLSSNKLLDLKLGIFDALKKLKYLDLSNNSLRGKDLSPFMFDGNKYVTYIDFSKNDFNEAPENLLHAFIALETLILNECFLEQVPVFATRLNLKTLKNLKMMKNQIRSLKGATFVNLESLEKLDLTANFLEELSDEVFIPLRKLKIISLRNNRLSYLPDKLFQNLQQLGNVDLSVNKIEMVPVNAFRGSIIKNLNLSNNRFTYLIDNFCLELRNSGVKLSKFYFNDNPWQCACLREIMAEVKKFDIEYNSAYYNGEYPVCTTTEEFACKRQQELNDLFISMYDNIKKKT